MAKLFNNIRKKLISEKPSANRTANYLKYAIGEIVLVVIGILVALSINTWNENRKKSKLKNEYIASLKNDFTKDTIQLNARINLNKETFNRLNIILDSIGNGQIKTIKGFKTLYKSGIYGDGIRIINTYNTNSFKLLISSGNVDLLDKQLREDIMELNRLQNTEQEITSSNRDYLFTFMQNTSLKYPNTRNLSETDDLYKLLWKGVNIDYLPKDIISFIGQKSYTISRYLELTEDVLKQTELVLKQLNHTDD